ncbi:alpha/beta hydrolase domain-containing protein [Acidisphaera rubrifaciens]|uniref:alpha/beta hydrolase domain-containing protein n=1 Tax=Acidisphaera rubrifaciens TaxID=50715 RepID=UPI00130E0AEA|nr:alpha/beta hydrolase domain-containing protein [Acidisphaera rubrifaciens]
MGIRKGRRSYRLYDGTHTVTAPATPRRRPAGLFGATLLAAAALGIAPTQARITKIVIDSSTPYTNPATTMAYTAILGRAFGTLDPKDRHNAIIQDIELAPRDSNGQVAYVTVFQVLVPATPNGRLWYDVPNRGGNAIPGAAFDTGAVYVQSGWQGDILGLGCATGYPCVDLNTTPATQVVGASNAAQYVLQVPVAQKADKTPITGPVYTHVALGTSGTTGRLVIFVNNAPYLPATLDTSQATLWSVSRQSVTGLRNVDRQLVPSGQWSYDCNGQPAPGSKLTPFYVCYTGAAGGFDPDRLYELVYPAKDPLVLGIGYAATRDLLSFLHHASTDSVGTANPVAGMVKQVLEYGVSQSGAFIRTTIHLGFNQDEDDRQVADGAWPHIDGRQLFMNVRFALPDVITNLYMMADEAPVWWADYPDPVRHHRPFGILTRCSLTGTCPQILETFGSDELYEEKMSPDLVGTTAQGDIPLPPNVHRYYFPSTTHGGGSDAAAFTWSPPPTAPVTPSPTSCAYPGNPNPESDQMAALQADFIAFLTDGTPMPPDAYPRLANRTLVAPTRHATRFPDIPGYPYGGAGIDHPEAFDFGPRVNYYDQTGIITIEPPEILAVEPEPVPPVNADGNETVGVPSVTLQVPLGTYSGWNLYSGGPYQGQQCSLSGSFWPFQETIAAQQAADDPRPSLEQRYGTHAGYVCAVTRAAAEAVERRFLLPADAQTLITDAAGSNVLTGLVPTAIDQGVGNRLCAAEGR